MPTQKEIEALIESIKMDLFDARLKAAAAKESLGTKWRDSRLKYTNPIYKIQERLFGLNLTKTISPGIGILYDVKVTAYILPTTVGVVVGNLKRETISLINPNSGHPPRTYDILQYSLDPKSRNLASKAAPIELKSAGAKSKKSAGVVANSIEGGMIANDDILVLFKDKSTLAEQLRKEKKLIADAIEIGANIVLRGKDVITNAVIEIEINPKNLEISRIVSYDGSVDQILLPQHISSAPKPSGTPANSGKPNREGDPRATVEKGKGNRATDDIIKAFGNEPANDNNIKPSNRTEYKAFDPLQAANDNDIINKEGNNIRLKSQPGNFRIKIGNAAKWILKTATSVIVEEIVVNILSYGIRKIFGIKSFEEKLNDKLNILESEVNDKINREIKAKSEWIEWSFRNFPGKNIYVQTVIGYEHWDNELYKVWLDSVIIGHHYWGNVKLPQKKIAENPGRLSRVESITNHFQLILPRDIFGTWMFSRNFKGKGVGPNPCGIFWIKLKEDQIEISGVGIAIRPFLRGFNEFIVSDDTDPNKNREGIYTFEKFNINNISIHDPQAQLVVQKYPKPDLRVRMSFSITSDKSERGMHLTLHLNNDSNTMSVTGSIDKFKFFGDLIRAEYSKDFQSVFTIRDLNTLGHQNTPGWVLVNTSASIEDFKNYYYNLFMQKNPKSAYYKDLVSVWDAIPTEKIEKIPEGRTLPPPTTLTEKIESKFWEYKAAPLDAIKKPVSELIRPQLPPHQRYTEHYMDRAIVYGEDSLTPPDFTLYFVYEDRFENKVLVDKVNIIAWAKANKDTFVVYNNIRNGRVFSAGNPSKEKEAREYWYQFLKSNESLWKKDESKPVEKIISQLPNGVVVTTLNYKKELIAYLKTPQTNNIGKFGKRWALGIQFNGVAKCVNPQKISYFEQASKLLFDDNLKLDESVMNAYLHNALILIDNLKVGDMNLR